MNEARARRIVIPLVLAAPLIVAAAPARAGVLALTIATVMWDQISVSLPPRTATSGLASSSEAHATYYPYPAAKPFEDPSEPPTEDESTDWGATSFSASLASGSVKGQATTATDRLEARTLVALVGDGQGGTANARVRREARFFLLESGTITITVPFRIDTLATTTQDGETASAIGSIELFLVPSTTIVDTGFAESDAANGSRDKDDDHRTLIVTGAYRAGDEVRLGIEVLAHSDGQTPIPSPASLVLMVGALPMLYGSRIARRTS